MDPHGNVSDSINASLWINQSQPPPYPRLSPPAREDARDVIMPQQQVSMGYQVPDTGVLWQEKRQSPRHSPVSNDSLHPNTNIGSSAVNSQAEQVVYHTNNGVKRRSDLQHGGEQERKHARLDGSTGSNSSTQMWSSSQVEEYAETLVAQFDGSLATFTPNDLAIATAAYGISEALLAFPPLTTTFKQEAPSPENHVSKPNTDPNHVPRNFNAHPTNGNIGNWNNTGKLENTTSVAAPTGVTSGADNANIVSHSRAKVPSSTNANLQQLLYPTNDDYRSPSGNQVSSSQQGGELNESRFQYVLAAATSIATKVDEPTLTYLNQGQSYEIKLKKLGDLSAYRGKILKSSIRLGFHERRLQYTEKEQITTWENARPGDRLIEVDVPQSYGMLDLVQCPTKKNCVEFRWDPTKEVGVHIKVNCISTEFTQKKHGGEKGVPFRIQVDTLLPNGPRLHAASCQIKVFKLKGADRKHKQDLQKTKKRRVQSEQFHTGYPYTMLTEISLESPESLLSPDTLPAPATPSNESNSPISPPEPSLSPHNSLVSGPIPGMSGSDSGENEAIASPSEAPQSPISTLNPWDLSESDNPAHVRMWLRACHFENLMPIFSSYWGYEMLHMTQAQLVGICGQAEGIRLFNAIHIQPRRTMRFAMVSDPTRQFRVIKLYRLRAEALRTLLVQEFGLVQEPNYSMIFEDPAGTHTVITDNALSIVPDWNLLEIWTDPVSGRPTICIKPYAP